jgi:hypothetical protein
MWRSGQVGRTARGVSRLEAGLGGNHLLVEDANDANAFGDDPVKDDVLTHLVPMQAFTNCIAGPTHSRIFCEKLKGHFQSVGVPN